MEKEEFIKKLVSRFSYYTEKDTQGSYKDTYKRVLTRKIDYEKLWDLFCNEYASKTPPTGVELKKMAKSCYLEEVQQTIRKWLNVKMYNPITKNEMNKDCFPLGTSEYQIIKTYEKMFKCTGWKILEIY